MDIVEKVSKTIHSNKLLAASDKILVACSGGIDSMVLVNILQKLNFTFSIVHIDHNSRNGQSKNDADFVETFSKNNHITFYSKKINVNALLDNSNLGFQALARNERYAFFDEVCHKQKYTKVVLAHHADDSIETFFINLSRGSGIKGLLGIPMSRDNVIRPLIELKKQEIIEYGKSEQIDFRQDESNFTDNYQRNYLRNKIIPEFHQWSHGFDNAILKTISHLNEAHNFVFNTIALWKVKLVRVQHKSTIINLSHLFKHPQASFILFNVLSEFHFNKTQVEEMLLADEPGKTWKSESHISFLERNHLIYIKRVGSSSSKNYSFGSSIPDIGTFIISLNNPIEPGDNYIVLDKKIDINKIEIRHWIDGDYMQVQIGKKKLKKLFGELKIDNFQKKELILIAHKAEVLWIVGKKKGFVKSPSDRKILLINK